MRPEKRQISNISQASTRGFSFPTIGRTGSEAESGSNFQVFNPAYSPTGMATLQRGSGTQVHTLTQTSTTESTNRSQTYGMPNPAFDQPFQLSGDQVAQATGTSSPGEQMYYNGMEVLSEKVLEHEVTVPRKIIVEETYERIVVVPEKRQREEIVEEKQIVRERVVNYAKPVPNYIYVDEVEEIPVDKVVEVPQYIVVEKIVTRDKPEVHEYVREVPKIQYVDKEVPQEVIEYHEVPVEKVVEVQETKVIEQVVKKPVNQYVEVEIPDIVTVEVIQEVHRNAPVPVEHIVHKDYNLPTLEAEYEEVPLPVFVPSFTEIPVPAEYLTDEAKLETQNLKEQVAMAAASSMPSLCLIEDLGHQARRAQPGLLNDPVKLNARMADKVAKLYEKSQPK